MEAFSEILLVGPYCGEWASRQWRLECFSSESISDEAIWPDAEVLVEMLWLQLHGNMEEVDSILKWTDLSDSLLEASDGLAKQIWSLRQDLVDHLLDMVLVAVLQHTFEQSLNGLIKVWRELVEQFLKVAVVFDLGHKLCARQDLQDHNSYAPAVPIGGIPPKRFELGQLLG